MSVGSGTAASEFHRAKQRPDERVAPSAIAAKGSQISRQQF